MKYFKSIIMIMLAALLVAMSGVTAFATDGSTAATEAASTVTVDASGNATVNGKEAAVGETVTYTFSIADCTQKITGIHLVIFFDQTALSLEEVNADNLTGNTIVNDNVNNNGQIIITNSFVNGSKGLDCSEKTTIVTATFKVIAPLKTEITYYMPYLYDIDVVNIYDYTFSYDLSVGDAKVVDGEAPMLAGDEELVQIDDKGDFLNHEDGIGDGKPAATEEPKEPVDKTVVLTISVVAVVIVAIVALIIVKVVMDKKSAKEQ